MSKEESILLAKKRTRLTTDGKFYRVEVAERNPNTFALTLRWRPWNIVSITPSIDMARDELLRVREALSRRYFGWREVVA